MVSNWLFLWSSLGSFVAGWIVGSVQTGSPLKQKIRVLQLQLKNPTWQQESRLAQEVTLRRLREQASSKEAEK